MKIPLSWLRKYVPVDLPPHELAHRLTMAGNEVGEVETVGGDWERDKLVVGHVLKVDPHPNADRLMLPTVELGGGETAVVVCGAPNVAAGQKIAFAREGASLYSPRSGRMEQLKRAKIRGVESAGMVCSPLELGLGDDHDGILTLGDDAGTGHAAGRLPGRRGAGRGGDAEPAGLPLGAGHRPRGGGNNGRTGGGAGPFLPGERPAH